LQAIESLPIRPEFLPSEHPHGSVRFHPTLVAAQVGFDKEESRVAHGFGFASF
jgi:hypothetical protein